MYASFNEGNANLLTGYITATEGAEYNSRILHLYLINSGCLVLDC